MRLTLLIPELLWSDPRDSLAFGGADASRPAALLTVRPPAQRALPEWQSWEHSLLAAARLADDVSLAGLRAAGDGIDLDGDPAHWLCADPVHLRFHQNRLLLADATELALEPAECSALAASINEVLAPVALRFTVPGHGYLRLASPPPGRLIPLSKKTGCEVSPADFGGDAALRRLSNEIQMLLHAHPVNQAREATGKPMINALWLWGAGSAPRNVGEAASPKPRRCYSHRQPSSMLAGVARAEPADHAVLTADLPRPDADTLVLTGGLIRPAQYQDSAAYAAAWAELDREVLMPALKHLRRGALDELVIVAPTVFGELRWSLTPWQARHAWLFPPRRPLSSLAALLAGDSGDFPA